MADQRTTVVIDYQNVHLTGHDLFARYVPKHKSLVHPLLFAQRLVRVRNQRQTHRHRAVSPASVHAPAALSKVLVLRGQPSMWHDPDDYNRDLAQKMNWESDRRVSVTMRPLKYDFERDAGGVPVLGPDGRRVVRSKREKGIDVLCALALVREARAHDTDLVILASLDSDLEPALDEAFEQKSARVETFSWYHPVKARSWQLRPTSPGRTLWNTRLAEADFLDVRDPRHYT